MGEVHPNFRLTSRVVGEGEPTRAAVEAGKAVPPGARARPVERAVKPRRMERADAARQAREGE